MNNDIKTVKMMHKAARTLARPIQLAVRLDRFNFAGVIIRRVWTILGLLLFSTLTMHAANCDALAFKVSGTVEVAGPGSSSYTALQKGQKVPIGSTIRTGDDGVAVLVTTPGSAIQLGSNSILKVNGLAFAKSGSGDITQRQAILQLTSGVVSALIDHDTPKVTDFKIQTPQGAAAARGTFYAVLVFNGKTYIGVKEGKVAASAVIK
jgi:hypothetical protein